jgi:hypothetical protein
MPSIQVSGVVLLEIRDMLRAALALDHAPADLVALTQRITELDLRLREIEHWVERLEHGCAEMLGIKQDAIGQAEARIQAAPGAE